MAQCSSCGAEIPEGQVVCPNCGARFYKPESDVPQFHLRDEPSAPSPTPELPTQRRKLLCAGCQRTFFEDELRLLDEKFYCPDCFAVMTGQAKEKAAEIEMTEAAEEDERTTLRKLWYWTAVTLLALITIACVYVILKGRRLALVPDMLKPSEFASEGKPGGTGGTSAPIPERPIKVPYLPDEDKFECPVCGRSLPSSAAREEIRCDRCGTLLRFVPVTDFPSLRYVDKQGEKAIFDLGGKRIEVERGHEIREGSKIIVDEFLPDGVMLAKVVKINIRRGGEGGTRVVSRELRLKKLIRKYRTGEPEVIRVRRGTKTIQCNGRVGNKVYHAEPVTIELPDSYPGTYFVDCPSIDCWKRYQVVIEDFPPIRVPISEDQDELACPVCGFKRLLVQAGKPESFNCIECDRRIEAYLWTPPPMDFIGWEENEAVVMREGKVYRSKLGAEVLPGSGIINMGTEFINGREFLKVKCVKTIEFTDFRGEKEQKRSVNVTVHARIPKKVQK